MQALWGPAGLKSRSCFLLVWEFIHRGSPEAHRQLRESLIALFPYGAAFYAKYCWRSYQFTAPLTRRLNADEVPDLKWGRPMAFVLPAIVHACSIAPEYTWRAG